MSPDKFTTQTQMREFGSRYQRHHEAPYLSTFGMPGGESALHKGLTGASTFEDESGIGRWNNNGWKEDCI